MPINLAGKVIRTLRLPTTDYSGSPVPVVSAEQGDINTRYLKVVMYDDGGNVDMSKYDAVLLKVEPPDGENMASEGQIIDGAAYCTLLPEMLVDRGKLRCNVVLGNSQGNVLTSKVFYVYVSKTNLETGGENYNILITLVQRVNDIEKSITEAESGREDAETVRVNNEFGNAGLGIIGRVPAEDARVLAEQARITSENQRSAAEQERITAENARKTAETTRQANETVRQETYLQIASDAEDAKSAAQNAEASASQANERAGIAEDSAVASAQSAAEAQSAAAVAKQLSEETAQGLAEEIQRATGAESKIASDLSAEIERSVLADQNNAQAIIAERNRAQAVENDLQAAIATETTRALTAESTISAAVVTEVNRATVAEAALAAGINTETIRAQAAEQLNANNIVSESNRAKEAEAALGARMDVEIPVALSEAKGYADQVAEQVRIDGTIYKGTVAESELPTSGNENGDLYWISDFDITEAGHSGSAIFNGKTGQWDFNVDRYKHQDDDTIVARPSDGALKVSDTVETGLTADTADFGTSVNMGYKATTRGVIRKIKGLFQRSNENATAISEESARAKTAEGQLAADIATETARAQAAEQTNANSIAAEVARATEAEQIIAQDVANEIQRAKQAEQQNANAIADEVQRAQTAEAGKVDKVTGKELSTEDYSTTEKNKLAGIASGAQVNQVNEAPDDGKQYARKNRGWAEVEAGDYLPDTVTNFRGVYDDDTTYQKNDVVTGNISFMGVDGNSTFVSLVNNNKGNRPLSNESNAFWRIIGSFSAAGFVGRSRYPEVSILGRTPAELSKKRGLIFTNNDPYNPVCIWTNLAVLRPSTHQITSEANSDYIVYEKDGMLYDSRGLLAAASDGKNGAKAATTTIGFTDGCDVVLTGNSNHQTAINNAISALPADGGKILLREGVYYISAQIEMNKPNVVIEGMGVSTELRKTQAVTAINITKDSCIVQNLYINSGAFGGTIVNIENNASKNAIINNSIESTGNAYGIWVGVSQNNIIENNIINTNTGRGIGLNGTFNIIKGNFITTTAELPIGFSSQTIASNSIIGNILTRTNGSPAMNIGANNLVIGNRIITATSSNAGIDFGGANCTGNLVALNKMNGTIQKAGTDNVFFGNQTANGVVDGGGAGGDFLPLSGGALTGNLTIKAPNKLSGPGNGNQDTDWLRYDNGSNLMHIGNTTTVPAINSLASYVYRRDKDGNTYKIYDEGNPPPANGAQAMYRHNISMQMAGAGTNTTLSGRLLIDLFSDRSTPITTTQELGAELIRQGYTSVTPLHASGLIVNTATRTLNRMLRAVFGSGTNSLETTWIFLMEDANFGTTGTQSASSLTFSQIIDTIKQII